MTIWLLVEQAETGEVGANTFKPLRAYPTLEEARAAEEEYRERPCEGTGLSHEFDGDEWCGTCGIGIAIYETEL